MFNDLNEFIAALDKEHELSRIADPVSPDLEICAVTDRASKSPGGGPALLFERPTGFDIPVAINLFGSMKRICMALGVRTLNDLAHEIEVLTTPKIPAGMIDALKMLPMVNRLRDLMPKTVSDAPCQEVVSRDGSLDDYPILKCWPEDGGRYITLPLVFTKDPETGARNIGTYRMQVFDGRSTGMHWQRHKGGAQHYRVAERLHKRMPVAVALGPDPALTYAATAPMPEGLDELMLAGFLRRERVELVKCISIDLEVPANAQIILEDMSSPVSGAAKVPSAITRGSTPIPTTTRVHVTCITHRKRPVYLTTVVGIPPMEDYYLGMASERIFLPLIRKTLPEIVDMHFPAAGIFHNIVLVSIDKRYPGHARKIMNAFWGLGQLMFSKTIIVVDNDVDVQNEAEVAWIVGTHYDPERDISLRAGPWTISKTPVISRLRQQRWNRCDAQWPSEDSPAVADPHRHQRGRSRQGRGDTGRDSTGMEMISDSDAQEILESRDLIAIASGQTISGGGCTGPARHSSASSSCMSRPRRSRVPPGRRRGIPELSAVPRNSTPPLPPCVPRSASPRRSCHRVFARRSACARRRTLARRRLSCVARGGLEAIAEAPLDRLDDPASRSRRHGRRACGAASPRPRACAGDRVSLPNRARDLQKAVGGSRVRPATPGPLHYRAVHRI